MLAPLLNMTFMLGVCMLQTQTQLNCLCFAQLWHSNVSRNGFYPNISALLCFQLMEHVDYQAQDPGFPSTSRGKCGYFVSIAEHVIHAMMFNILSNLLTKHLLR